MGRLIPTRGGGDDDDGQSLDHVVAFLIRWKGMVFGSSHLALGSSFNCSSNKLTHPGRPAIIPAKLGVSVEVVGVDIVRRIDLNFKVVEKSCCWWFCRRGKLARVVVEIKVIQYGRRVSGDGR